MTHKRRRPLGSPAPSAEEHKPPLSFEGNSTEGDIFLLLLLNKHAAAKFTVLFLYNPGVNMSAAARAPLMCFYKRRQKPRRWNKLQIFVRGIKRGLHRRQHVLKQILAKMLCRGILLIDAVLFPF